jgi:spermidine/putrescine-binding protein
MKEDLIADLWNVVAEHLPEKTKKDVAYDFINTLMDYGVKETVLEGLQGIDPYLDEAIDYAIDGEEIEEDYDDYNEDDED